MEGFGMRYIINDDDFEEWIKKLEEVQAELGEYKFNWTLQYVVDEMKLELEQHKRTADEE